MSHFNERLHTTVVRIVPVLSFTSDSLCAAWLYSLKCCGFCR